MQNAREYQITFKIRIGKQANKVKISPQDFIDNCPNGQWVFSDYFEAYDSNLIKEGMKERLDDFVQNTSD